MARRRKTAKRGRRAPRFGGTTKHHQAVYSTYLNRAGQSARDADTSAARGDCSMALLGLNQAYADYGVANQASQDIPSGDRGSELRGVMKQLDSADASFRKSCLIKK